MPWLPIAILRKLDFEAVGVNAGGGTTESSSSISSSTTTPTGLDDALSCLGMIMPLQDEFALYDKSDDFPATSAIEIDPTAEIMMQPPIAMNMQDHTLTS